METGAASDCIFCRIVAGEAEASLVGETETVVAFLDVAPINPGHTLVVPRVHAPSLGALGPSGLADLAMYAAAIGNALRRTDLNVEGINLLLADGAAAGQEVDHVHLHVVPRHSGDGFRADADAWREAPPRRAELDALAAAMKVVLAAR